VTTLVILQIIWESWHTVRYAEVDLEHIDDTTTVMSMRTTERPGLIS